MASSSGPAEEIEIKFLDRSRGDCFPYLRARLVDGRLAISSPIWLERNRPARRGGETDGRVET